MIRSDIRTPIEILVDSVEYFNNCLQAGQYFFTDYRPKLHDLEELGKLASMHDPIFQTDFPRNSEEEQRLFDLLKRAYIDSRYKEYSITKDELDRLAEHVMKLQNLTEEVCKKKVESFKAKTADEHKDVV